MTVTLTVAEGYEYDNKHPGYGFTVDIYNKCGKGDSITFEEALEHIDGRSLLSLLHFILIQTTRPRGYKNNEYDQEIPQSQTADKSMAPRGRATQQSRATKQSNKLSLPHQDNCKTRMGIK